MYDLDSLAMQEAAGTVLFAMIAAGAVLAAVGFGALIAKSIGKFFR